MVNFFHQRDFFGFPKVFFIELRGDIFCEFVSGLNKASQFIRKRFVLAGIMFKPEAIVIGCCIHFCLVHVCKDTIGQREGLQNITVFCGHCFISMDLFGTSNIAGHSVFTDHAIHAEAWIAFSRHQRQDGDTGFNYGRSIGFGME